MEIHFDGHIFKYNKCGEMPSPDRLILIGTPPRRSKAGGCRPPSPRLPAALPGKPRQERLGSRFLLCNCLSEHHRQRAFLL